jgi:hypothetical protein
MVSVLYLLNYNNVLVESGYFIDSDSILMGIISIQWDKIYLEPSGNIYRVVTKLNTLNTTFNFFDYILPTGDNKAYYFLEPSSPDQYIKSTFGDNSGNTYWCKSLSTFTNFGLQITKLNVTRGAKCWWLNKTGIEYDKIWIDTQCQSLCITQIFHSQTNVELSPGFAIYNDDAQVPDEYMQKFSQTYYNDLLLMQKEYEKKLKMTPALNKIVSKYSIYNVLSISISITSFTFFTIRWIVNSIEMYHSETSRLLRYDKL